MEYVLGIDIGTGSVKAVAIDLQGNPLNESQHHYPFTSPKNGYHEQDPELIWQGFTASIKDINDRIGSQLAAVGLSSAMHSLIPVDESCRPLAPMMTWADNRSWAIAEKLRASAEGMAVYRTTGTPLHAMSPLCKLIWLRENEPGLFKKAYKFISIKDYIWYRLFNEFKTDHSIASGMGLFDIRMLKWHPEALALAGISAERLSEPVRGDYTRPSTLQNSDFLKAGIPITIGASDGCLANLGSMANTPGTAAITIGTSGAVRVASSKPLPNDEAMTFSYILDNKTYICGGPVNNGGIAMQWWLKNFIGTGLTDAEYEQTFQKIAAIPAGSNGLFFLPYLTGERAPIWDSASCGTFFGIKLRHTRDDFSKAVLEGICYALKDVLAAVQQNVKLIKQINISGGFVQSAVWVQVLADITGKNLAIVQTGDASATGAAFMAMKAADLVGEYPAPAPSGQVFKPDPANAAVYDRNFMMYRQLYASLKASMHQVSGMNG
jgi:gluconokinase